MQGFYVSVTYHSFSIKFGGDVSVLDEAGWLAEWVALMKQILESDVCKVSSTDLGSMHSLQPYIRLSTVNQGWLYNISSKGKVCFGHPLLKLTTVQHTLQLSTVQHSPPQHIKAHHSTA